jgi:cyanate permease
MGFATWAPMLCVPPMEHILKEELSLTHAQTSLLFTAPLIMMAALSILGGLLADRIGIRKAAGIGAIMIAVGSILRGTATDFSTLLAFTFTYGAGIALAWPNLPKLVSLWVPRERITMATGIYIAASYVGFALPVAITMPLVFPITNTFQGAFFVWGIPTIVAAILWWGLIREPPSESVQAQQVARGDKPSYQIWRNKSLWLVAILFLLHQLFCYNWIGWAPALMMLKGATPSQAGLIASLFLWTGIPTSLLIPRLSNKLGLRKPFLWLPSITLAFASLGVIYITVPMGWPLMILAGIVSSAMFLTIMTLPVEMMPKEAVGTATGLMLSIGDIGGIIGPWIGGHIFDLTGSLNPSFLVLTGVAIAAAGIAFRLPETGPKARAKQ